MGFGPKVKTLSKLASMNALYRHDNATFGPILNTDVTLVAENAGMALILTQIKQKVVGASAPAVPAPKPFPCPTTRWMGRLAFDTTTKGTKPAKTGGGVDVTYTYDHKKAMALNALSFRGRCDDIVKYYSMEDDAVNSPNKPNPGGQAGTHGKLPQVPV